MARLEGGPLDGISLSVEAAGRRIEMPAPPVRQPHGPERRMVATYALIPRASAPERGLHVLRYAFAGTRPAAADDTSDPRFGRE